MRKLVPSLIALTMAGAFASLAQAQSTDTKTDTRGAVMQSTGQPGASPAQEPSSTNSRADVKGEAHDAARKAEKTKGASPAQKAKSTSSRAEVKSEIPAKDRAADPSIEQKTMPQPSK